MPVQRSIFGRPVPALAPRRIALLLATIAIFAVITLIFTLPTSIPSGPSLSRFADHKLSLPKLPKNLASPSILHPFRQAAHAPPVQNNSTNGESTWYSNWNWLSPFSSSVTLDENRSLLPPLMERTPIYTYYDHTIPKEQAIKDAYHAILVTWRKAWWAQGFKPIILSPAEAMNNPLYAELQLREMEPAMRTELSRWLAWENMGTGLLCNYLTLPMGSHEDPLLSYLRRGEYPSMTRFDNMGSGLFSGSKADITAAVKVALESSNLKTAKDFISLVPPETFEIDPHHDSLAYYNDKTINDKYPKVAEKVLQDLPQGLKLLNQLTISHLHTTWQNSFSSGIAVVKPLPKHMTSVVDPALQLAKFLAQCPESPLPSSCPPNFVRCKPCVASTPMRLSTPYAYRNTSDLYTIGTVPHPYTTALLSSFRDAIDVPWIRRESERDTWISTLTKELSGTGVTGRPRLVKFKEIVASQYGTSHSLWLTAEKDLPSSDLDWYFGFPIPRNSSDTGKSETPVPGPERRPRPDHDEKDGPVPNEDDREKEKILIGRAKEFGAQRTAEEEKLRKSIEAWNLADTEAWRFAKAFLARSRVERLKWEEEEQKFAGGAGAERGRDSGWGRWLFDD